MTERDKRDSSREHGDWLFVRRTNRRPRPTYTTSSTTDNNSINDQENQK